MGSNKAIVVHGPAKKRKGFFCREECFSFDFPFIWMTQFHTRPDQIEMSDLLKDYLLRIGIVEEVFCVVSLFGMLFGALDSAWGKLLGA